MEFLRQFVYASERDEVENFTMFQDWRNTKEETHSSIWGDYGPNVASVRDVDLKSRKIFRWDDGFTEVFAQPAEGIRRARFSLGGRVTILMEEFDRRKGKLLPMRFWVFNQDWHEHAGRKLPAGQLADSFARADGAICRLAVRG